MTLRQHTNARISPDQREGEMPSARTANAANRALDGVHGVNGLQVRLTPYGMQLDGGVVPDAASFDYLQSGPQASHVHISEGYLVYHGTDDYLIPQKDLVLAGGPKVYVYIEAARTDLSSGEIKMTSGARPKTDTSFFKCVLWEFTFNGELGYYESPTRRAGGNDVQIIVASRG